ncbi:hypothetical protein bwei_5714 [Bacillus mycoides]|nr:hypothetical protein bwei_5714 [Bacillus mycoides]GAE43272.1 hypothetical protein BW1_085_00110 [Bacillus mycoides NBRC 101238 = DSM 11821]
MWVKHFYSKEGGYRYGVGVYEVVVAHSTAIKIQKYETRTWRFCVNLPLYKYIYD